MTSLQMRIARPTKNLDELVSQYCRGLGFEILGSFRGHAGYDGVMLGHSDAGYHLEFTFEEGVPLDFTPTHEHLLVFYLPDLVEWSARCEAMARSGFLEVESQNPYWDVHGKTFEDLDGYRIVLQQSHWPPSRANP